eukprot:gene6816-7529_t
MPSSPAAGVELSMGGQQQQQQQQQQHTGEENGGEGESETDNDALSSLLMLAQANDGVPGEEEEVSGLPSPSVLIGQPGVAWGQPGVATNSLPVPMMPTNNLDPTIPKGPTISMMTSGLSSGTNTMAGALPPQSTSSSTAFSVRRYGSFHHQNHHHHAGGGGGASGVQQSITLEDLRRYFHLPIAEVARHFNTCTTALKKICRKLNINKWPYRQILSLTKSIQSLEMASLNEALDDDLKAQYRKQILILRKTIAEVVNNPSKIVVSETLSKHATTADEHEEEDSGDNDTPTPTLLSAAAMAASNKDGQVSASGIGRSSGEGGDQVASSSSSSAPKKISDEDDPNVQQVIMAAAALISSRSTGSGGGGGGVGMNGTDMVNKSSSHSKRKISSHASLDSLPLQAYHPSIAAVTGKRTRPEDEEANELAQEISLSGPSLAAALASRSMTTVFPEVGSTTVRYNAMYDNSRNQFVGPVQLAPLQRRKLRQGVGRKVVPLMEPDIGSHFQIEFTPHFIMTLLHKSLIEKPSQQVQQQQQQPQQQQQTGHGKRPTVVTISTTPPMMPGTVANAPSLPSAPGVPINTTSASSLNKHHSEAMMHCSDIFPVSSVSAAVNPTLPLHGVVSQGTGSLGGRHNGNLTNGWTSATSVYNNGNTNPASAPAPVQAVRSLESYGNINSSSSLAFSQRS